ncbi:MAG TPA: hypothetical protein VN914_12015 [Polyangia bacterium]|nr:hypothetical protein [Polyangia bacterium]
MNTRLSLVLASICLGCAGEPPSPLQAQLDQAAAMWARDKPSCAPYHYARVTLSFTGSTRQTAIEITNDHPSRRRYDARFVQDNGEVTTEHWDETGAAIGSHEDGHRAETVEELFAECRAVLGQDAAANRLTLEIGAHGVPTDCVFVPKGCEDDCGMGFNITDFACGPLP